MTHKWRIAWTSIWGIVGVSLMVLSIRSFWWRDSIYNDPPAKLDGEIPDCFGVISFHGNVIFTKYFDPFSDAEGWGMESYLIDDGIKIPSTMLGFAMRPDESGMSVSVPYWLLITMAGVMAAVPWTQSRIGFSLRTFLIAIAAAVLLMTLLRLARQYMVVWPADQFLAPAAFAARGDEGGCCSILCACHNSGTHHQCYRSREDNRGFKQTGFGSIQQIILRGVDSKYSPEDLAAGVDLQTDAIHKKPKSSDEQHC